ncbi:MAG: S1 family peptidase, partial [Planctomycetota bacterium]|nr:S1 family peptidase [Planctomycetota bacterium]
LVEDSLEDVGVDEVALGADGLVKHGAGSDGSVGLERAGGGGGQAPGPGSGSREWIPGAGLEAGAGAEARGG